MLRRGEKERDRKSRRDHPAREREKTQRDEKHRGDPGEDERAAVPRRGRRVLRVKAGEEGGQLQRLPRRAFCGRILAVPCGRCRPLPIGVRGLLLYEIQLVLRRRREMLCHFLSPTNVFGHILTF